MAGPNDVYVNLVSTMDPAGFEQGAAQGAAFGAQMEALSATADESSAAIAAGIDDAGAQADTSFSGMTAGAAEVDAALSTTAASVDGATADMTAALREMSAATDTAATDVDAAYSTMTVAQARVAASQDGLAAQYALSTDAMRASLEANIAKMNAAEDSAIASNERLGASMESTGGSGLLAGLGGANVVTGILAAAAAIGAIGIAATDMASKVQASEERLVTSAGETQSNLAMINSGLESLAGEVGISVNDLATGLYTIESAGFHGADGLTVLKAAAQGAVTENAQLGTVANAVTDILNDYHMGANEATQVTSAMIAAVSQGKTTFQDLSGAMSNVSPVAAAAGVSITDLLGDLSEMTAHGISADEASQQLANTIRSLSNPTSVMTTELGQLGISSTQLSQNLGKSGVSGALESIEQAVLTKMGPAGTVLLNSFNQSQVAAQKAQTAFQGLGQQAQAIATQYASGQMTGGFKQWNAAISQLSAPQANLLNEWKTLQNTSQGFSQQLKTGSGDVQAFTQAMAKATGNSSTLQTALTLTGENFAGTQKSINAVTNAIDGSSSSVSGFAEQQKTLSAQLKDAKGALDALMVEIGQKIIPIVTPVVHVFAEVATWLAENKAVAEALGYTLGAILAVALAAVGIAIAAIAVVAAPTIALIWGWVEVFKHAGDIGHWFAEAYHAVAGALTSAAEAVGHFFAGLASAVSGGVMDAIHFVESIPSKIGDAFVSGASAVGSALSKAWSAVGSFFSNLGSDVLSGLKELGSDVVKELEKLPYQIGFAIGFIGGEIYKAGLTMWNGLVHGLPELIKDVVNWFTTTLPNAIKSAGAAAGTWLLHTGEDIWHGLTTGLANAWDAVWHWFTVTLPTSVENAVVDADVWLLKTGIDIWHGLTQGLENAWTSVVNWFIVTLPHFIQTAPAAAGQWLLHTGEDIWHGLTSGLANAWTAVVNWFTSTLPNMIINAGRDAWNWLVQAGKDVINGLIHGIESAAGAIWDTIKNIGSGIVNGFKSALGINSPSKIMADIVGTGITEGIAHGMTNTIGNIHDAARTVSAAVAGADYGQASIGLNAVGSLTANGSVTGSLSASPSSTATAGTVVNITVQGNAVTEKELVYVIQTAMAQHGSRNSQTYRQYKR